MKKDQLKSCHYNDRWINESDDIVCHLNSQVNYPFGPYRKKNHEIKHATHAACATKLFHFHFPFLFPKDTQMCSQVNKQMNKGQTSIHTHK